MVFPLLSFQATAQALLLSQLQLSESQFKVNDLFKVTDEPYSGFCSTFNIFLYTVSDEQDII